MDSGIYYIENKLNGKVYIGSAVNLYNRFKKHRSLLNRNMHANQYLQNSWNKNGEINFTFSIIEYVDKHNLLKREQYHIDNFNGTLFNIRIDASSNIGLSYSNETKKKMSLARSKYLKSNPEVLDKLRNQMIGNSRGFKKGEPSLNKGKTASAKTKFKISYGKSTKNIFQLDLEDNVIKKWDSMKSLIDAGFSNSCILRCINGERKTHRGYKWKANKNILT